MIAFTNFLKLSILAWYKNNLFSQNAIQVVYENTKTYLWRRRQQHKLQIKANKKAKRKAAVPITVIYNHPHLKWLVQNGTHWAINGINGKNTVEEVKLQNLGNIWMVDALLLLLLASGCSFWGSGVLWKWKKQKQINFTYI